MSRAANRLASLDGLRGAAALVVVFSHATHALLGRPGPALPLLGVLWNGQAAVIIFFVLSGLVLSLPYWQERADGWDGFLVRRLFRIYPLFALSIAVVPGLIALVQAGGGTWRALPGWPEFLSDLAMVDRPADEALNTSAWTLIHEMRISLVFPALILAMRALGRSAVPAAFAFSTLAPMADGALPYGWAQSWLLTCHFVWLFVLGAEIARNLPALRWRLGALPLWPSLALVLLALAPLGCDLFASIGPVRLGTFVEASAGLLVLLAATLPPFVRALETRPLQWLGRVSYSLYLIHAPILAAAMALLRFTPPALAAAIGIAIALVAAELLYRSVERPSLRLGRDLARRLADRPAGLWGELVRAVGGGERAVKLRPAVAEDAPRVALAADPVEVDGRG